MKMPTVKRRRPTAIEGDVKSAVIVDADGSAEVRLQLARALKRLFIKVLTPAIIMALPGSSSSRPMKRAQ